MPEDSQFKYHQILFGLKIKETRLQKNMSFSELSQASGLSVSYLNEIERGKKNPKSEKKMMLLNALGIQENSLDFEINNPVVSLLKSNFLNELPLDLYGLDLAKIIELIAFSPDRVNAFISTLIEISKNYNLNEANFYFTALRSYLEIHSNYFKDIEDLADEFLTKYGDGFVVREILENELGVMVDSGGLDHYDEFKGLRAVFLPGKNRLLTASFLSPLQMSFECGKEIGFRILKIKQRAYTSSILKGQSFEEVLNHSKAIYFSVAIHLPRNIFIQHLKEFLQNTRISGSDFLDLFRRFEVSPEMFFQRLTNVLPEFFRLKKLFFLRIIQEREAFRVEKALHLNTKHYLLHVSSSENYCRRFLPIALFKEINNKQEFHLQRSKFLGFEEEFLTISMGIPSQTPHSLSLSIQLTDEAKKVISFWNDPGIVVVDVNRTCERCAWSACKERVAPPMIEMQRKKLLDIERKIIELN
jgi:XRE family transcriptional regulator, fatty acid utilization regulator